MSELTTVSQVCKETVTARLVITIRNVHTYRAWQCHCGNGSPFSTCL